MLIPIRDAAHWHELRSRNVGASEVACLFGIQAYEDSLSRYALWQVLAGRMDRPTLQGKRLKAGLMLEEVTAQWLFEETGIGPATRCGYAQHPTVPRFGASPDFILPDGRLLETKAVDWLAFKRKWAGEPPDHILIQMQGQLACVPDAPGVVCAGLVSGADLQHWEFPRRPKLIAEIERRVTDFIRSVDEGREPDIDGSESTYQAVKARLPHAEDNSAIECDDLEFAELCVQVTDAKAEIKRLDAVRRECEAKLMHRIAGARRGYGMGWSATLIERAGTPEKTITEDMVGQTLPGRKGSVSLQVREMTK